MTVGLVSNLNHVGAGAVSGVAGQGGLGGGHPPRGGGRGSPPVKYGGGRVVIPLAAATVAGWLLLFVVLLVLPPASQPRRDERAAPGIEPPAVVSLLAGRLERDGFGVTLADLAARGWL